jgi:hypothetical protein
MKTVSLMTVDESNNPNNKELTEKALGTSSVSQEAINIITTKQQSFFGSFFLSKTEKTILAEKEQKDLELVRYELEARNNNFKARRETETKLFKLALNMVLERGQVSAIKGMNEYYQENLNSMLNTLERLSDEFYTLIEEKAKKADNFKVEILKRNATNEINMLVDTYAAKKAELITRFEDITKNGVK